MLFLILLVLFVLTSIVAGIVRGRVRQQYRTREAQDMELYGDQARNRPIGWF